MRDLEVDLCHFTTTNIFLNNLAVRNQLESFGLDSIQLIDDVCNVYGYLKNLQNLKLVVWSRFVKKRADKQKLTVHIFFD